MSSEEEPVMWLRKEIGDDLAFARACLQRPIWGTDFDAVNERVARCEAELAILDACAAAIENGRIPPGATWSDDAAGAEVARQVVHLLAGGYRHRPGFPATFAA